MHGQRRATPRRNPHVWNNADRSPDRASRLLFVSLAMLLSGSGCAPRETRLVIVNHRAVGDTERLYQDFGACYYDVGPDGNIDLVARSFLPADGENDSVTQIVHVRTVFRAIPGRTHAESSMINARVNYAILSDTGGTCFEGAGFFIGKEDRRQPVFSGELERAELRANRRVGDTNDVFTQTAVSGTFCARRDPKQVVTILNELARVFGPQPRYQPLHRSDPM